MHCGRTLIGHERFRSGYMISSFQEICKPLLNNELRVMSEIRTGTKATARSVHGACMKTELKTTPVRVDVHGSVESNRKCTRRLYSMKRNFLVAMMFLATAGFAASMRRCRARRPARKPGIRITIRASTPRPRNTITSFLASARCLGWHTPSIHPS